MSWEVIIGLIPGGILLAIFIIGLLIEFFPRKRKPKFWVEVDENGNLRF